MQIVFRPGDGRRLAIGLALAIKECEKAQNAMTVLALLPYPPALLERREQLDAAAAEVRKWLGEYGDAPKMVDVAPLRREAFHIGAYCYNVDTEKLRERKEKQKRNVTDEDEEIAKTGKLIDWLLARVPAEEREGELLDAELNQAGRVLEAFDKLEASRA